MKNIFINIGYPNTASTSFKRNLYNNHSEINYLGIEKGRWIDILNLKNKETNLLLLYVNYYILHSSIKIFENNFKNLVSIISLIKFEETKTNLISFTGYLNPARQSKQQAFSEYNTLKNNNYNFESLELLRIDYDLFLDPKDIFSRLNRLFNASKHKKKIKIILFLRNQTDLFKSFYNHFNIDLEKVFNRPITFKKIIKQIENSSNIKTNKIINYFNYFKVYNDLVSEFKEDNVEIFFYEKFKKNNERFIIYFSNFLEINQNESIKLMKNKIENRVFRHKDGSFHKDSNLILILKKVRFIKNISKIMNENFKNFFIKFLSREIIKYSNYEKKIIYNFYQNSNEKLSNKININLKKIGY